MKEIRARDKLIDYYVQLITSGLSPQKIREKIATTEKDKQTMTTKKKADKAKATKPSLNCLQKMPFARSRISAMSMPVRAPIAFDEDGNAILEQAVFELVAGFTLEISEMENNASICIRHARTDYTFSFTDPVSVAEEIATELDEDQATVCEVVSMALEILGALMENA